MDVINEYTDKGFLVHSVPVCTQCVMDATIYQGTHELAFTQDIMVFIYGEISNKVWDRFNILLPSEDMVHYFDVTLHIYCIMDSPQENCRPWIILNMYDNPDMVMNCFNDTTTREAAKYYL